MKVKSVLTIAGSDSGGGAGIQADLKTCAAMGVFGTCAITALTAQNTRGVQSVFPIPSSFVREQITSVMTDIKPFVWKTGMLATEEIIQTTASLAKYYGIKYLVVDPVLASKNNHILLEEKAIQTLIEKLFPLAYVVTPNTDEASVLSDIVIKNESDMRLAAEKIKYMGPRFVLIKGGHMPRKLLVTDILFDGKTFIKFPSKWVNSKNTHGTGCVFSAGVAAQLAKGKSLISAIRTTKKYMTTSLEEGKKVKIGSGFGPVVIF